MKAYDTSYLFDAKNFLKNSKIGFWGKKLFLTLQKLSKKFQKNMNISGNTEPSSTNLVSNESL